MNYLHTHNTKRWTVLTSNFLLILLLCVGCGKNDPPQPVADTAAAAPAEPQATGLVKNPVKLSDTADAVKWMDMASTKTPAQIATEEKLAKEAKEAKLVAQARQARDIKQAADAKLAAEANIIAARDKDAKEKEAFKVAAAVAPPPAAIPKVTPVVAQVPTLNVISKEQPKYPKSAAIDGITSGMVTAQVSIETDGRVSKVDIIKATPRKYFDKSVIAAALQWKYAPVSKPMTAILEFNFKLDGDGS